MCIIWSMQTQIKSTSYVIVANGDFLPKEMILEATRGKIIVALDGAGHRLLALGVRPTIVLGDFDSSSQYEFDALNIPTLHLADQNSTDLTKGIIYCDKQGATQVVIICAVGGRLDHHEGNLRALRAMHKPGRIILLYTEQQCLRFAKDESITFFGEVGDKCGVLAYPHGFCTSQGLTYEMTNHELHFALTDSTCNSLATTKAAITITGEALLIMPRSSSSVTS